MKCGPTEVRNYQIRLTPIALSVLEIRRTFDEMHVSHSLHTRLPSQDPSLV